MMKSPNGKLPPGPRSRALQRIGYLANPYTFLWKCRERYGDPFTIHNPAPTLFTGNPDGIRQIFTAPPEHFYVDLTRAQRKILGEGGLTSLTGAAHKRERRLLAPSYRGAPMRALGEMMRETALTGIGRWRPGEEFLMRDAGMAIALDVILRTVFGVTAEAQLVRFRAVVRDFVRAFGNPGYLLLAMFRLYSERLPPNARVTRARSAFEALLDEAIAERRADPDGAPSILGSLLTARYDDGTPMEDAPLRDNLITNLVAGHETSAFTIAWAIYWILSQPECRERVQAEVDALPETHTPDDLSALPYLDAVVNETLRVWPLVPEAVRMIAQPLDVLGYTVEPGANVAASTALLHYNPEVYPEPHAFRPERFLNRRMSPFEFMPFGGGERVCIGAAFSVYEVKIVVGTIMRRCRLTLLDQGPMTVKRSGFLMGPRSGVRVRYDGAR